VRLWYVGVHAGDGARPAPLRVQDARGEELDELVSNLNQGKGYLGPGRDGTSIKRAHPAPLYPWVVSHLSWTPVEREALYIRARWVQCGLGALTAGLLFLFARHAFASLLVGFLAGVAAALYPFWIINTAEINDGVLASFLLALALFLAVRSRGEEFATSWLYGLSLAGLALTRAALLPFALVALLWFLRRCQKAPSRAIPALLAVLGFASGLAPWVIRNFEAFGDVVPIVDSTYHHLWLGNHPGATGGPARNTDLQTSPEPNTDRERGQVVLATIRSEPAATCQRRLWAGLCFFCGEDWLTRQRFCQEDETAAEQLATGPASRRFLLLAGSLLVLLALAAVGWRWSYARKEQAAMATLAVLLIPLPYLLSHGEALSGPRLPLDGVLICLAAYAAGTLVAGIKRVRLLRPTTEE
jgi:hypothetical protein